MFGKVCATAQNIAPVALVRSVEVDERGLSFLHVLWPPIGCQILGPSPKIYYGSRAENVG